MIRNTGEESRNSLKFRCGKPVSCPRSGQCDGGLNRANLITLAILSAGGASFLFKHVGGLAFYLGVLLEGDARGIEWLGKRYFTTLGNLSIDLSGADFVLLLCIRSADLCCRLDRIYYEAENGTTSILFLAQWWSDQGSQLGQIGAYFLDQFLHLCAIDAYAPPSCAAIRPVPYPY